MLCCTNLTCPSVIGCSRNQTLGYWGNLNAAILVLFCKNFYITNPSPNFNCYLSQGGGRPPGREEDGAEEGCQPPLREEGQELWHWSGKQSIHL